MRLRLVGYSGVRPPVPGTTPVDPVDPPPDTDPAPPDDIPAPLVLVLANGSEFMKGDYLALGYNRFDVMCIGGAGGQGGRFKQTIPDSATYDQLVDGADIYFNSYRFGFGGAGGGGGVHRVKGRLALLPSVCPIVVGQPGEDGAYFEVTSAFHNWRSGVYAAQPDFVAGTDGGASSFGGNICRASGGKAGSATNGGAGGIGNAGGSGGGAAPEVNGVWNGTVGSGGGGGQGSVISALNGNAPTGANAKDGGKGAVSVADPNTGGPAGSAGIIGLDFDRVLPEIIYPTDGSNPHASGKNYISHQHADGFVAGGGFGGGARPFLINGDFTSYGSKVDGHPEGLVIVRLTYAIV